MENLKILLKLTGDYGEFENTIEIDQYRSVVTDFTL